MDKFIGKINGVEYANREEFYKALAALKPEDNNTISLMESYTSENEKESKQPTVQTKQDALGTLCTLFTAFLKSLDEDNKDIDKNEYKEKKVEQPVEQKPERPTFETIMEHFGFNETTYTFTGGERDELELDKFDGLLAKRAAEFANADWDNFDCDALTELREEFASRYEKVARAFESTNYQQHELDTKLAKVERLISAYEDLDMDTAEVQEKYKNMQTEFDILDNKANYYELLKHYYGELIKVIDAQY